MSVQISAQEKDLIKRFEDARHVEGEVDTIFRSLAERAFLWGNRRLRENMEPEARRELRALWRELRRMADHLCEEFDPSDNPFLAIIGARFIGQVDLILPAIQFLHGPEVCELIEEHEELLGALVKEPRSASTLSLLIGLSPETVDAALEVLMDAKLLQPVPWSVVDPPYELTPSGREAFEDLSDL